MKNYLQFLKVYLMALQGRKGAYGQHWTGALFGTVITAITIVFIFAIYGGTLFGPKSTAGTVSNTSLAVAQTATDIGGITAGIGGVFPLLIYAVVVIGLVVLIAARSHLK